MGYFPFFVELRDRSGLVVGGGAVAERKLRTLLPLGPRLTVVAPELTPGIQVLAGLRCLPRAFRPEDLVGQDFVIAATDDRALNRHVAELCRERKLPVDVADAGEEGTFLFPALVRRGDVTVGICTGGTSPAAAAYLRRQVEGVLPERTEEILAFMAGQRRRLRDKNEDSPRRQALLGALLERCMEAGRPLTAQETQAVEAIVERGETERG